MRRVSEKQKLRQEVLRTLNYLVWMRDEGVCLICQSPNIQGEPYKSGSHHILSRGICPERYLDVQNLCLLCKDCHTANADTREMRKKLLKIMKARYGYDYDGPPYKEYFV